MEIHGALNGTKCLIVILTNGAAAASSSKEHRHDSIPFLISSIIGADKNRNNSMNSSLLKLLESDHRFIMSSNNSSELDSMSLTTAPSHLTDEFLFDDVDYTLDIVMPLIVGLVVAMILGWMLIRYKMSAHTRSNYNGSIYCCPEECYIFCARFFKCNLLRCRRRSGSTRTFKWPKLKKRNTPSATSVSNPTASNIYSYGHPQVLLRYSFHNLLYLMIQQIRLFDSIHIHLHQ